MDGRELIEAVRAILDAGSARDRVATSLYKQTISDIELLPAEEQEDLRKEAWLVFERLAQRSQDVQIQALRQILK